MAKPAAATSPASTMSNRGEGSPIFDEQVTKQLQSEFQLLTRLFDGPAGDSPKKRSRDAHETSASVGRGRKRAKKDKTRAKGDRKKEKGKKALPANNLNSDLGAAEGTAEGERAEGEVSEEDQSDQETPSSQLLRSASRRDALLATIVNSRTPDRAQSSQPPKVAATLEAKVATPRKRAKISHSFDLPSDYKATVKDGDKRYACPVVTCSKDFSRRDTLKGHVNKDHVDKGHVLATNPDNATMSIIGYSEPDGSKGVVAPTPSSPYSSTTPAAASAVANLIATVKSKIVPPKLGHEAPATPKAAALSAKVTKSKKSTPGANAKTLPTPDIEEAGEQANQEQENSDEEEDYEEQKRDREFLKRKETPNSQKPESVPETPKTKKKKKSHRRKSKSGGDTGSMEDWETDPGKLMRHDESDHSDDEVERGLAFSSNLTLSPHFISLPGITFQVIRIPCGPKSVSISLAPVATGFVQLCSVAAGKVIVTVSLPPLEQGSDKNKSPAAAVPKAEFAIGLHGAWCLKAGESCTVSNVRYEDAVLHVSVIRDME